MTAGRRCSPGSTPICAEESPHALSPGRGRCRPGATELNPDLAAPLLDRSADAALRNNDNRLPADLAKEHEHLKDTDVYWQLNDD